jgi:hypothetical protein
MRSLRFDKMKNLRASEHLCGQEDVAWLSHHLSHARCSSKACPRTRLSRAAGKSSRSTRYSYMCMRLGYSSARTSPNVMNSCVSTSYLCMCLGYSSARTPPNVMNSCLSTSYLCMCLGYSSARTPPNVMNSCVSTADMKLHCA